MVIVNKHCFARYLTTMLLMVTCLSAIAQKGPSIVIGQSVPLTGVVASAGIPLAAGSQAYIDAINALGGIRGRPIKLITLDDGFQPERSFENVKKLIEEHNAVAILNVIGAPNNEGLIEKGLLAKANVPLIGPYTASSAVREFKSRHVFFVTAGAKHEASIMIRQTSSMGLKRVGVMFQDDLFGRDGLAEVQRAAREQGATVIATGRFERNTENLGPAIDALGNAQPQAIFIFAPGVTSAKFSAIYRKKYGKGTFLISSSAGSANAIVAAAPTPADAAGIGLVQVLPNPSSSTARISIEYRKVIAAHGPKDWMPSGYGLQGYINARLLVEALQRIGDGQITGSAVIRGLESLKRYPVGELLYDFSEGNRQGIVYTDIGIIGPAGKLRN